MKTFINQGEITLTKINYTFALKICLFQYYHMNQDLSSRRANKSWRMLEIE